MKKIISVLLCAVMLFVCFGVAAFADETCEHEYSDTVVAPGCVDDGYTLRTCTKCGDYYRDSFTKALGHSYGMWVTVNEATCTEEGHMQRVCSRCGSLDTETVSVLDHKDANGDEKCDMCGAYVKKEYIFSPFDWLKALFKAIREWFAAIFA